MSAEIVYEKKLLRGRFIVFNQKPNFDFLSVKQIHSQRIVDENICNESIAPEADGIIGNNDIPKAITTADCLPIILLGKNDEHAVIHAGWRGLAQNILSSDLIKKMEVTYAFLGPHIRSADYEVQKDFLSNFPLHQDAFTAQNNKITFNLSLVAAAQLKKIFPAIAIEDCDLCTFSEPQFFSYRKNQTKERNWNVYFPK